MNEAPIDISRPDELLELRRQIVQANNETNRLSIREMMTVNAICNTRHMMTVSQLVDSFVFMEQMLEQVRGKSGAVSNA